jgi:hypothetical protein
MQRFPKNEIIAIKQAGFIDKWDELQLWQR